MPIELVSEIIENAFNMDYKMMFAVTFRTAIVTLLIVFVGDINTTSTIEINGNQYNGPVGWNYTTTYILNVK